MKKKEKKHSKMQEKYSTDSKPNEGDVASAAKTDSFRQIKTPNVQGVIEAISQCITSGNFDNLADFFMGHREEIREAAAFDEDVAQMLVIAFKMGIAQENGLCANNLGAMYYMGDIVEQDYAKAAELYEMAMQFGCHQSMVNLGYIYEYGRIGEPDYQKAYQHYALAAALNPTSEALYKLGDMYSRGQAVDQDLSKAYALWEKSLRSAFSDVDKAQPAIRFAPLLLNPANKQYGITYDPLRALTLYQRAEIGLRIDIDDGQTYYRKRLQEAIEGQSAAREKLDGDWFRAEQ